MFVDPLHVEVPKKTVANKGRDLGVGSRAKRRVRALRTADMGVGVKLNSTWGNGQAGGGGSERGGAGNNGNFRWGYFE